MFLTDVAFLRIPFPAWSNDVRGTAVVEIFWFETFTSVGLWHMWFQCCCVGVKNVCIRVTNVLVATSTHTQTHTHYQVSEIRFISSIHVSNKTTI